MSLAKSCGLREAVMGGITYALAQRTEVSYTEFAS